MKKVLIVDDDAGVRNFLKAGLEEFYEINLASDGLSAVNLCNEFKPDLIILDVVLPDILGMEVLKKIKENCTDCIMPKILILTGAANFYAKKPSKAYQAELEAKELWIKQYGVSDFLSKPFSFDLLLSKIKSLL